MKRGKVGSVASSSFSPFPWEANFASNSSSIKFIRLRTTSPLQLHFSSTDRSNYYSISERWLHKIEPGKPRTPIPSSRSLSFVLQAINASDVNLKSENINNNTTTKIDTPSLLNSFDQVSKRQLPILSRNSLNYNLVAVRHLTTNTPPEQKDEEEVTKKFWTIPNVLSLLRIAITPYLSYLLIMDDVSGALKLFLFAGFTDFLDGLIAKNVKGQRSIAGSYLDPLADKFLMTVVVTTLGFKGLVAAPLAGLIVLRDVLLVLGGVIYRHKSLPKEDRFSLRFFHVSSTAQAEVRPTVVSKANTVLQLGLVLSALGIHGLGIPVDPIYMDVLGWTVAATTVVSGLGYLFSSAQYVKRK